MIKIADEKLCSGCGACAQTCSIEGISMKKDAEGFLRPFIDERRCKECKACINVCPVNKKEKNKVTFQQKAYAVINLNNKERKNSSSGGVFVLLARQVLCEGGVVFGAKFEKDFSVKHDYVEKEIDLYKLQCSKYVQSDIANSYKLVKQFLTTGRKVLFSGTPCQVAGLKTYLNKDYVNLITQDFVCHGVPSPLVWKKYIEYIETKEQKKIKHVKFRAKENGWRQFNLSFEFEDGTTKKEKANEDLYMRAFLSNLSLRPSCYNCSFKALKRESDITLADFWGIEKVLPEMDDDKGTSFVTIHSTKGGDLFELIRKKIRIQQVRIIDGATYNSAMIKSVIEPQGRKKFFKQISKKGFINIEKNFFQKNIFKKIRSLPRWFFRKLFK